MHIGDTSKNAPMNIPTTDKKDGQLEGHAVGKADAKGKVEKAAAEVKYRQETDSGVQALRNATTDMDLLKKRVKNNAPLKNDIESALDALEMFDKSKDPRHLDAALSSLTKLEKYKDADFGSGKRGVRMHEDVRQINADVRAAAVIRKNLKQFCSTENKELMKAFQKNETAYLLEKHQKDADHTWITKIHTDLDEHVDGAFGHLEERANKLFSEQIPIVLGGLELRKHAEVEDQGGTKTKGFVPSFGSLHQPGKLDAKSEDEFLKSRRTGRGYGGVLETEDYSMTFNLIAVLAPSVFTGEPIYYGRESDTALGLNSWERSITKDGKIIGLDIIRETDNRLEEKFKQLPNVKAKESPLKKGRF